MNVYKLCCTLLTFSAVLLYGQMFHFSYSNFTTILQPWNSVNIVKSAIQNAHKVGTSPLLWPRGAAKGTFALTQEEAEPAHECVLVQ